MKKLLPLLIIFIGAGAAVYLGWSIRQTIRPGARRHQAGIDRLAQKQPQEALSEWISGIKEDPGYEPNYTSLGDLYSELNKHDDAAILYRRAVKLKPNDGQLFTRLSREEHLTANENSAYEDAKRAAELLPDDATVQGRLGLLEEGRGKYGAAIPLLRRGVQGRPGTRDLVFALLRSELQSSDFAGTQRDALAWLAKHPGDSEALLAMAKAYSGQPHTPENVRLGTQYSEQAARAAPDNAEGWAYLGKFHMDANRIPEAITAFKRGYEVQPYSTIILHGLVSCYARTGQTALRQKMAKELQVVNARYDRISVVNEIIHQSGGKDIDADLELSRLEVQVGNIATAGKLYRQLLNAYPDNPKVKEAVVAYLRYIGPPPPSGAKPR